MRPEREGVKPALTKWAYPCTWSHGIRGLRPEYVSAINRYMRVWIDILAEAFSEKLPFRWVVRNDDYWRGVFVVDTVGEYDVSITQLDFPDCENPAIDVKWFDMSFGLTEDYFLGNKVIGTNGMVFKIFSTVLAAFDEFITTVKPQRIMINASKDNHNRFQLYKRIEHRLEARLIGLGYHQVEVPEHRYAKTHQYFDSIGWVK